ncbi:MAG TPA: ACT domain-containing protein [Spirochaetota bacterium]|nr:ACT domain-containing protein [Spirochaetota bacterium]
MKKHMKMLNDLLKEHKGENIDDHLIEKMLNDLGRKDTTDQDSIDAALRSLMEQRDQEREVAVVSVIGKDTVGIVAEVTRVLAESNANIEGMNQTVLHGFFALILTIDISVMNIDIDALQTRMDEVAGKKALKIYIQHENIFKSMNRI